MRHFGGSDESLRPCRIDSEDLSTVKNTYSFVENLPYVRQLPSKVGKKTSPSPLGLKRKVHASALDLCSSTDYFPSF
jgi:hypothetical protein